MKLLTAALTLSLAATLHAQAPERSRAGGDMQAMHHDKPPVPPSRAVAVTSGGKTTTVTIDDLAALPQVTVHVHNAHLDKDEAYSGPLVVDVLAKAGFTVTHDTEQTVLHSALMVSATDHYFVVFSLAEVAPGFSRSQTIVAILKDGAPDTGGGNIQLINTDGAKPARWVHGLSALNIMTLQQGR